MTTILRGKEGETMVAEYLQQRGYRVVSRNFRTRFGELDIVAQKHHTLYIVEVKMVQDRAYLPEAKISAKKRRALYRTSLIFLQHHNLDPESIECVFSLATVTPHSAISLLHHIPIL